MIRRLLLTLSLGASLLLPLSPAAAGGGCHAPAGLSLTASTSRDVAIAECAFQDTVTYIEPGQSVTWFNKDELPHTVTGAAGSWGDDLMLYQGDTASFTFEDAGVFPYYCVLHPSMVGAVVVGTTEAPAGFVPGGIGKSSDDGAAGAEVAGDSAPATEPAAADGGADGMPLVAWVALAATGGFLVARLVRRPRHKGVSEPEAARP